MLSVLDDIPREPRKGKLFFMFRFLSFKLFAGVFCSLFLLMSVALTTAQAHPHIKHYDRTAIACNPSLTGNAFPYSSPLSPQEVAETGCSGGQFSWGWTTAGSATGAATWTGYSFHFHVTIYAFIPSTHAGAQDAQYFIHEGSRYVANITVNQNNVSGWVNLGTWNFINEPPSVTLRDLSPSGSSGWQVAASAIKFYYFS